MKHLVKSFIIFFIYQIVFFSIYTQTVPLQHVYINKSNYLPNYNNWISYRATDNATKNLFQNNEIANNDSLFNWQYVNIPYNIGITDIYFFDSLYGWATYTSIFAGVARTKNSGFDWDTSQLVNGGYMSGVHFIDRLTGWAVGGYESNINKTTNGGNNWIKQDWPDPASAQYYSVHFFNKDTGIITGAKDTIFNQRGFVAKTTDGGDNWHQVYLSDTQSTDLRRQFWINDNTGWVCGGGYLKTTNGGDNFLDYYSHFPQPSYGANGFNDIYFINENTGWICGNNWDNKNLYKTTDGGENWTFQNNPVTQYTFSQINGIRFINPDTGWASSYVGLLIVTTNGGLSWSIDYAGVETILFSSYKNTKIWCSTGSQKIFYTFPNNPIGIFNNNEILPKVFILYPNYPNPFNPSTKIKFSIPAETSPLEGGTGGDLVKLIVFDMLGREITTLVNEQLKPGTYEVEWNASDYPSGVYFYKLQTESFSKTKKMILIK